MTIEELNQQFAIRDQLVFSKGAGGLPIARFSNTCAEAVVSLYGAQVLHYKPVSAAQNLLWVSSKSLFQEGKAIRGGIPLCFPWFGPHPSDQSLPQHGFARLSNWEVAATDVLENGATSINLQLHHTAATKALWPFEFSATLTVIVGSSLEVKLNVLNTGEQPFTYSDALHSYLKVSQVKEITIEGLHKVSYYDGFSDHPQQQQETLLTITKEENRRYVDHTAPCLVADKGYNRNIRVSKKGSKVTVVWNPGKVTAKTMSDVTEDGYQQFICVEAANSYADIITLSPGDAHILSTSIELETVRK